LPKFLYLVLTVPQSLLKRMKLVRIKTRLEYFENVFSILCSRSLFIFNYWYPPLNLYVDCSRMFLEDTGHSHHSHHRIVRSGICTIWRIVIE